MDANRIIRQMIKEETLEDIVMKKIPSLTESILKDVEAWKTTEEDDFAISRVVRLAKEISYRYKCIFEWYLLQPTSKSEYERRIENENEIELLLKIWNS